MPRRSLDGSTEIPEGAVSVWDRILDDHPHDILAFRLAHFVNFWSGRPEAMLASVLVGRKALERFDAGVRRPAGLPLLRA